MSKCMISALNPTQIKFRECFGHKEFQKQDKGKVKKNLKEDHRGCNESTQPDMRDCNKKGLEKV